MMAPIAKSESEIPRITNRTGEKFAICSLAFAIKSDVKSTGNSIIVVWIL